MEIKEIVDSLEINGIRDQLIKDKKQLFKNEREMALLTHDREVGLFAFNFDEYLNLIEKSKESDDIKLKKRINELEEFFTNYEMSDKVNRYVELRNESYRIINRNDYYYKLINIYLRGELSDIDLPQIYVKYGNKYRHIIDDELIKNSINSEDIVISPIYDMESKRDYRHFYNKVSFHYLEELSNDCEFGLENKKLGKVLVKNA